MKSVDKNLLGRLYVLLSFIIIPFGSIGLMARITLPDVILAGAILLLFGVKKIYNPKLGAPALMILFFFGTAIFSLNPVTTVVEIVILLFLLFSVLVVYNVYFYNLKRLFLDISIATTASFIIGIYDFFAGNVGLPRLFPSRAAGEILSTFRNAGQAGAYVLIMLAILLPARLSSLKNSFTLKEMRILNIGIISGVMFLLVSGKIAAYIGFFFGIFFLNIVHHNAKALMATLILGLFLTIIFLNLEHISPELDARIQSKIESRIVGNIDGTHDVTEEGFIAENIKTSLESFQDNPLSGSGIGAFTEKYGDHEVHSTYFKIIGEGGVLGFIGYSLFFIFLLKTIRYKPAFIVTDFQQQLIQYKKIFMPFFWGCAISWAYTYHLRKREFWIMLTVILIINSFLRDPEKKDDRAIKA